MASILSKLGGLFGGRSRAIDESSNASGLTITAVREDKPKFTRVYSIQVTPEVHMEITTKDYGTFLGRSSLGELEQRSGAAVWFEPERPADKILDRELLPHVQEWCKRILQIDKDTFRKPPDEFTDESGQKWQRVG